jgi:hypothetical protein
LTLSRYSPIENILEKKGVRGVADASAYAFFLVPLLCRVSRYFNISERMF